MLAGDLNHCIDFPCLDVRHEANVRPDLPARRDQIRVIMISAAPPADVSEAKTYDDPIVRAETITAFRLAGYDVYTIEDIRRLGVYVTTAVKCPKAGYGLRPDTIANCARYLEAELDMFPNVRSILLMGNTAIKAINEIAVRRTGEPAIPTGSAYTVKGHEYRLGDISLFPSYPTSGKNLSVELDRQDVIAVDIRNAIEVALRTPTRPHRTVQPRERLHSPESLPSEALR
ncbi:MAG: uracil-DNA glycosylase family protein [Acidimicrobiia bacterium]|nr:uracil-DNA glycosylase family protein [Acidimicrobiia bacterium]